MKIIDLNGKVIEIKNLDLAIMQADDYRHWEHSDPTLKELDKKQQAYWQDIYEKLLKLRQE